MTVGIQFDKPLAATLTPIPGLVLYDLPVHGDARGWFKENWQREKMVAAGLEDFGPVQNNVSFNDEIGTTRGIHAEPWDKYVSVATGRVFGAWVDLREGATFGAVFTAELDPSRAIFVPRGVGNSYQTLEVDTSYTYLVNDHWSPAASYTFLNLADESVGIDWPIPLRDVQISEKDRSHPRLADVTPMLPRKILILGANGQLGRALRAEFGERPYIEYAARADLDVTRPDLLTARRWRDYGTIINAAAYTEVDRAETADGRVQAWAANAAAAAALARVAAANGITLVHISSDYVFDGSKDAPYTEADPLSPLSVYGQSKAAGDAAVGTTPRHYIVRTSWVIGDGRNFVRTMANLAAQDAAPRVVDDQRGRPTFAAEIARAIRHLLDVQAPYGVYNVSGSGEPVTWAELARRVFVLCGRDPSAVRGTTTEEYFADAAYAVAPRPRNSVLDLSKIEATGFVPSTVDASIAAYLAG